jgi:hypothetical protein
METREKQAARVGIKTGFHGPSLSPPHLPH